MNAAEWTTLAVAIATGVLAFFTWRAVAVSRDVAQASKDEAGATGQLAREATEDRALAWRPHLAIEAPRQFVSSEVVSATIELSNVGNGPAVDCTVWAYWSNHERWGVIRHLTLAARSSQTIGIHSNTHPGLAFPEGIFDSMDGGDHEWPDVYVAACRDVLGNRWRFIRGFPPEMVNAGEREPPLWTRWYR